jgi:hypothetical protein
VIGCAGFFVWCATPARAAVVFGQVDDFQDGTTMGWSEGASTPNEPANASGGPGGAQDLYVRNVSSGGIGGAGSKQVMFNGAQWAGDYNAAGVTRVSGWAANFGGTTLHLRVAFSNGFNRFSSTRAVDLPADGAWHPFHIDIAAADVTTISGAVSAAEALSNVTELRLLSAASPSYTGDVVAATLGIDDLRAMRPEGDANFDGRVDANDFRLVRSNLGTRTGGPTWQQGDFNFDGRIDARDVALLRRNFGLGVASPAGISVVPEPTSCLVLAIPFVALVRRRR